MGFGGSDTNIVAGWIYFRWVREICMEKRLVNIEEV